MTSDANGTKSGLFLLETYLVPGYVFFLEGDRALAVPKPEFSPELSSRPDLMKKLRSDIREILFFVRYLREDGKDPEKGYDALLILNAFKTGLLRFFRDERNLPRVEAPEAFKEAFPKEYGRIRAFLDAVERYGPGTERIYRFPPGKEEDRILRMEAPRETVYDRENPEFTFTYLGAVKTDDRRAEAVRENAEISLQLMTKLLKSMEDAPSDGKEEEP